MNTESVDCVYFQSAKEADAHGAGAITCDDELHDGKDYPSMFIYLRLPGGRGRDAGALQGTRDKKRQGKQLWHIEGDPRDIKTFTVHPSIHLIGEWHGFLKAGRLESC